MKKTVVCRMVFALCLSTLFFQYVGFAEESKNPFLKENSPREELREKTFRGALDQPACLTFEYNRVDGFKRQDESLDEAIKEVIKHFNARNVSELQTYFHPRLKVTKTAIRDIFSSIDRVYKIPFEVSVFRLWLVNNPTFTADGVLCDEGLIRLFPLYGHPLQTHIWLQLMGQKELGRIFLTLVPLTAEKNIPGAVKGVQGVEWKIGAFHIQQWTHREKDYMAWTEEALQAEKKGLKEAAFIKYDLATKLSDGGPYLQMIVRDEILKAQKGVMEKSAWETEIKKQLKDWTILYLASILARDGAGIVIRIEVPKELSSKELHENCRTIGRELDKKPWFEEMGGIKCSIVVKGEDPTKEGVLGSIYMGKDEFSGKQKKVSPLKKF